MSNENQEPGAFSEQLEGQPGEDTTDLFLEHEAPPLELASASSGAASLQRVEAELRQTQARLQTLHEEDATTAAALRATKEELQSMNEALQTLNQELKQKVEEVGLAHSHLQNLFGATEIATLFLDRKLRVQWYTPRAAALLKLRPSDRNRPITRLHSTLFYERFEADAKAVLAHLIPVEQEVQNAAGEWFQVNVRPFHTGEDRSDGVVITFVNITVRKQVQEELQLAKEYAESIVDTVRESLLVLTPDLHVRSANESFYTTFRVMPEQTEGRRIYELGDGQWNIPELRTLLEEILPDNKFFNDFEITHEFAQSGRRTMLLNARRLDHVQLILLAIEDITARKQGEEALQQLNAQLEHRIAERTAELLHSNRELDQVAQVTAHDLRAPLRHIHHLADWVLADTQGSLPSSSQAHLVKVQERVQYLERLLDDLFVYAQARRQRQPFERVDVTALVQQVIAFLDQPTGFTVHLVEPMPVLVTERVALETVLRNLIGNAFKHHPTPATGQVTITAQVEDSWLEVAVADNGAGIDPHVQSRIFELFQTVKPRDQGAGSGIGLSLVRKLVESRGGTVALTSAVGAGATFRFTWPTAAALDAVGAAASR